MKRQMTFAAVMMTCFTMAVQSIQGVSAVTSSEPHKMLPYIDINDASLTAERKALLRQVLQEFDVTKPLSAEDRAMLTALEAQFDHEENMAGVAANQVGFDKKVVVFAVPDNPQLRSLRKDFTDTMPKTVWLNPRYEGIGEEKSIDYEGCFSVKGKVGQVERFSSIRYHAYRWDGEAAVPVTGIANGFLARVIQHEVDHLNGVLYIDKVIPGSLMDMEELIRLRKQAQNPLEPDSDQSQHQNPDDDL